MGEERIGSRKVILTKWMLVIFSGGTAAYILLYGLQGATPPESFFTWFVLGLGGIGGAFSVGNMVEHKYKTGVKFDGEKQ